MSDFNKIRQFISDVDMDKYTVSINIATGLVAAGYEILQLVNTKEPVDEIKLLQIIERHNDAKNEARNVLIQSIARRKQTSEPEQ